VNILKYFEEGTLIVKVTDKTQDGIEIYFENDAMQKWREELIDRKVFSIYMFDSPA